MKFQMHIASLLTKVELENAFRKANVATQLKEAFGPTSTTVTTDQVAQPSDDDALQV